MKVGNDWTGVRSRSCDTVSSCSAVSMWRRCQEAVVEEGTRGPRARDSRSRQATVIEFALQCVKRS